MARGLRLGVGATPAGGESDSESESNTELNNLNNNKDDVQYDRDGHYYHLRFPNCSQRPSSGKTKKQLQKRALRRNNMHAHRRAALSPVLRSPDPLQPKRAVSHCGVQTGLRATSSWCSFRCVCVCVTERQQAVAAGLASSIYREALVVAVQGFPYISCGSSSGSGEASHWRPRTMMIR